MLVLDQITENNVAVLRASGRLTVQDYEKVLPALEEALVQREPLRFYIELRDFTGMDLAALKEDARFDLKYKDRYGKIAIVGERRWQEWITRASDWIFEAPLQFFELDQADQAWEWVNS